MSPTAYSILHDASFRSRIRRDVLPANKGDNRSNVNDFPRTAVSNQLLREFLTRDQRSLDVDIDDGIDVFVREIGRIGSSLNAGAIEQDVGRHTAGKHS